MPEDALGKGGHEAAPRILRLPGLKVTVRNVASAARSIAHSHKHYSTRRELKALLSLKLEAGREEDCYTAHAATAAIDPRSPAVALNGGRSGTDRGR